MVLMFTVGTNYLRTGARSRGTCLAGCHLLPEQLLAIISILLDHNLTCDGPEHPISALLLAEPAAT